MVPKRHTFWTGENQFAKLLKRLILEWFCFIEIIDSREAAMGIDPMAKCAQYRS